jgi:uncharacterized membrane protein
MLALFIMSAIAGAIVYGFTGTGFLFWAAGGVFFVCGLPFAIVSSFIHGEVSYAQDRADYRQMMAELKAEELADEHEFAEDGRADRIARSGKPQTNNYTDNRQVHFHGSLK